MNKYLKHIIYILLVPVLSSCQFFSIEGSGSVVSEIRPVTSFSSIVVTGEFNIIISQGNTCELFLKMDDNLLENTITTISDNTLVIEQVSSVGSCSSNVIYISALDFKKIKLIGKIKMSSGLLNQSNIYVQSEGENDIDLNVDVKELSMHLIGENRVSLKGSSRVFNAEFTGVGYLESLNYYCESIRLETIGEFYSSLCVEKSLIVNSIGVGSIKYKGEPKITGNISSEISIVKIDR